MTPPADEEIVEYIAELRRMEQDPAVGKAVVSMGPYTAYVLIGALQLAIRHPRMSPALRGELRKIVADLTILFDQAGRQIITAANDAPGPQQGVN